jgi:hypothetical protein
MLVVHCFVAHGNDSTTQCNTHHHRSNNKLIVQCRGRILERNRDKSLKSFPSWYSVTLLTNFTPHPPLIKSGLKQVFDGNIKSVNSQHYAKKP